MEAQWDAGDTSVAGAVRCAASRRLPVLPALMRSAGWSSNSAASAVEEGGLASPKEEGGPDSRAGGRLAGAPATVLLQVSLLGERDVQSAVFSNCRPRKVTSYLTARQAQERKLSHTGILQTRANNMLHSQT